MNDDWIDTSLGEVTSQVQELTRIDSVSEYKLLGVRWYSEGPFHRETVTADTSKATRLFKVRSGHFIYNRMFAWKGAFGLVNDDLDGCFVSNEFPLYECDATRLLPAYLSLWFRQPSVWFEVAQVSTGTTASRSRWKEAQFEAYRISLPPLPVQRRIVDLMAHLDNQIANLRTERDAAGVLLSVVRAELMHSEETIPLETVLHTVKAGGTPSRANPAFYGGDIPWLKSGEVESDWITSTEESVTEHGLSSSSAWLVPAGTPVLAMYGATAGVSGFLARPMAANQAVLALVPKKEMANPRFLFHWLRLRGPLLKEAASGAAQPNLSKQVVLRVCGFPDIPLTEQTEISETLDQISALSGSLQKEIQTLSELRGNLLSLVLTQETDVHSAYDSLLDGVA